MSLSSSISNAFSGLTVTARAAQLVSSNLANALNENYARRDLDLSSYREGGAKVEKTNRFVDRALNADLRVASAGQALAQERKKGAETVLNSIGTPDDPASLTAYLNRFDASLRYMESAPSSEVRMKDTLATAQALTKKLNDVEADIQKVRKRADRQIEAAVSTLNAKLNKIVTLNVEIVSADINGRETSSLLDHRKQLVDEVSEFIPVREMRKDHEAISLVSTNGMILIEESAVQFDFTASNEIAPHMTLAAGTLNALTLNGSAVSIDGDASPLSGGRLQGLFEIRDKHMVDAQKNIDDFVFDLADRFHNLPNDTDSSATSPGLFTDQGSKATSVQTIGLAGRISINDSVDPNAGGELWRLRSGVQAMSESLPGDASFVADMISTLSAGNNRASLFDVATSLVSAATQNLSQQEQSESFSNTHFQQLNALRLENGVNTDAELQKLLQIESNYAANAKVMQTIDEMFAAILRIN